MNVNFCHNKESWTPNVHPLVVHFPLVLLQQTAERGVHVWCTSRVSVSSALRGRADPGGYASSPRLHERQMSPDRHSQPYPHAGAPADAPPAIASDERDLVAAILRKDRKAMAELVDRYADPVYAYVSHRMLPRTELVDDLVQDVFLAALEGIGRFRGESSLRGWLLGIARHKIEDHYRARLRAYQSVSDLDGEAVVAGEFPSIEDAIDRSRLEEKTRKVLRRLPEAYSVALLWRYWEACSAREMAARSGKTEKAVERLLARARAQFKQIWEGR